MTLIAEKVSTTLKQFSPLTLKDLVTLVGEEPEAVLSTLSLLAEELKVTTVLIEKEALCKSNSCSSCESNPGQTHYQWID